MKYQIQQNQDGSYLYRLNETFAFELGGEIKPLELVYETYGQLNEEKDNVILIHHGLSPNQHVQSHATNPEPGWWEGMIGPGLGLDPEKYFIICCNNLGSSFGSSSPASIHPETNQPYRLRFPLFTMHDVAHAQRLLIQSLGIKKLFAVIGNSMGGMISLAWAIDYPNDIKNLILISSCYKAYPANIANRTVQKEIIQLDPLYDHGNYQVNPLPGLVLARKLGHFTYRNPEDLNQKFINNVKNNPNVPSEVETYLQYNAEKFARQFDPNCYLYFLTAMDLYDVTRQFASKNEAFRRISARCLVISVDSDILFTPEQQQDLVNALNDASVNTSFIQHHSPFGHDTFLVEIENYGIFIREFLRASL